MILYRKTIDPDFIGVAASSLCFIHCAATPFLFVAKVCSETCCVDTPIWWQVIDYLFIIVSFAAIYYATKNSTKKWVRIALWSSWVLLLLTILGETLQLGFIPETFIYLPALAIVGLHFYNYKYCKCKQDDYCIE